MNHEIHETHKGRAKTLVRLGQLVLTGWLLFAGCKSAHQTGSTWLAAVVITNKTTSQIRLTTIEVFQNELYEFKPAQGNELIFEKRGKAMDDILYGGWTSSATWIRVKVRIRDYGPDARLLECNAYRVSGRGDAVFEDEYKYSKMKAGTFQKVLEAVGNKLQAAPPPAPPP